MTAVLEEIGGAGPVVPHSGGDFWEVRAALKLSGTYKTGGDITLSEVLETKLKEVGTGIIEWVDVQGKTGGYVLQYDYTNKKLMVFRTGGALKGALEQLPEEAYPAALTEPGLRVLAVGK
jgi:hypothetical protein